VRDSNVGSEEQDIKHANKKRSDATKKPNAAAAGMTKVAAKMREIKVTPESAQALLVGTTFQRVGAQGVMSQRKSVKFLLHSNLKRC
jgi:hypothetical protein